MKTKTLSDLRIFLDEKAELFNRKDFIELDPISIPHRFSKKEDIEISGLLSATISWGNRKSIITNAGRMMEMMHHSPYEFVAHHTISDLKKLKPFVHRTFNADDFISFVQGLRHIYESKGGLETLFTEGFSLHQTAFGAIDHFRTHLFEAHLPARLSKHVASPEAGSAAKRLNMYLRWMVRRDEVGVDFGVWKNIPMSQLSIPLDVHTASVSRKLGLLKRTQNDRKTVEELDVFLRKLDPKDPVKYDYALFGLGVSGF
ncbi:MAG: TIGR02757 family protein [Flavobacteriales bacterium]|nr:TIGR02757 family protein [Flavobacteriales bacterium]